MTFQPTKFSVRFPLSPQRAPIRRRLTRRIEVNRRPAGDPDRRLLGGGPKPPADRRFFRRRLLGGGLNRRLAADLDRRLLGGGPKPAADRRFPAGGCSAADPNRRLIGGFQPTDVRRRDGAGRVGYYTCTDVLTRSRFWVSRAASYPTVH